MNGTDMFTTYVYISISYCFILFHGLVYFLCLSMFWVPGLFDLRSRGFETCGGATGWSLCRSPLGSTDWRRQVPLSFFNGLKMFKGVFLQGCCKACICLSLMCVCLFCQRDQLIHHDPLEEENRRWA